MRFVNHTKFVVGIALVVLFSATARADEVEDSSPDFGREVRPVLARHCFKCHGPDEETRETTSRH